MSFEIDAYNQIRSGGTGFYEQKRGLIAVWGKEAVQFLDGLISNDVKSLEDGAQMLAAFPNAQGRLLALVRVLRKGDRFLFETDEATREKVFQNLFRFTFAGDFFAEDLSENYRYFEIFACESVPGAWATGTQSSPPYEGGVAEGRGGSLVFISATSTGHFIQVDSADSFRSDLLASGAVVISDELYKVLRIENGVPKYGVDMDETTIVPELGIDGLISYNKGCYIGQEIIARIHFRGHVAKQLIGLVVSVPPAVAGGSMQELEDAELKSTDGKNAGRITSITFSPKLEKTIALAYVRYDYLAEDTKLKVSEFEAEVRTLPFL